MTVEQLIVKLRKMDPKAMVVVFDNQRTFKPAGEASEIKSSYPAGRMAVIA